MKFYMIESSDDLLETYVFRVEQEGRLRVRDRYREFHCRKCGKVDEPTALRAVGIDDDVVMRAKVDIRYSSDDWMMVAPRSLEEVVSHGVAGLQELARNEHVVVLMPQPVGLRADVFEELDRCSECGRPSGRYGFPNIDQLAAPDDEQVVFGPEPPNETGWGRMYHFIMSEPAMRIMKSVRGARLSRRK